MTEEPYRWVEAIANRREYIETQLASGSPIAAVSFRDGILFLTRGGARQKLFEIYDRIAMGGIGHPGDIERLRMAAIELASTEGFTRSAADVSLRRLAFYSLSPVLKAAFEQVYGPPYLARMLFAEIGDAPANDLFLRIEYDGAIATNGEMRADTRRAFGVASATSGSTDQMASFLEQEHEPAAPFEKAFASASDAWIVGSMALGEGGTRELPNAEAIAAYRSEQAREGAIEAAILERTSRSALRYRTLGEDEIRSLSSR